MPLPKTVSSEFRLFFRDSFSCAPILQQDLAAARVALVNGLHLADAVGPEMPEILAHLASRHDDAHTFEQAQRERPDGPPRIAAIFVEIADAQFALAADRPAYERQFAVTGGNRLCRADQKA